MKILITGSEGLLGKIISQDLEKQHELIKKLKNFDLIIIDGSHKLPEVYKDATNGWKVLNKNGYMVFDDYNHPRLKSDIQPAVEKFCKATGARIQQITNKAVTRKV